MTEESPSSRLQRILVALDASAHGRAALDEAASLASQLQAELEGLFVEDINLLRLASLPFSQEIVSATANIIPMESEAMERFLRGQAETARRALSETADRASLQWSFRILRGRVVRSALEAASEADLIVVGMECCSPQPRMRGAAVPKQRRTHPILAVYRSTPGCRRVLATAWQLAQQNGHDKVVVLLDTDNAAQADTLRQEVLDWLDANQAEAKIVHEAISTAPRLVEAGRRLHSRALLISWDSHFLDETGIESLVNQLDCPVVLVR